MTDETMTVTLRLRWAEDDDGDSLLLLAGFPVGTVFSVGLGREWHAYGRGITHAIRIKSLSTQAEAMAALQAAVLKALRSPAPVDTVVAEVRADLLARSGAGIAKYGVTLDRTDLGHAQWLQHGYKEALDLACYLKRAMRDLPTAAPEPQALCDRPRDDEQWAAMTPAQLRMEIGLLNEIGVCGVMSECAAGSCPCKLLGVPATAAPVEPPHAAAPFLATLTPEPADAVLGRAGEALAGSLPVYVLAGTGRHPYGDDAWHMETDGVARLFPSKEAAQRWLVAMGKAA